MERLVVIFYTLFLMASCSAHDSDGIIESYKENLEQAASLVFVASDILYDVIMKDSHLLIEKNATRESVFKRGTDEFDIASFNFLKLLNESHLEECRPTNYWVSITLKKRDKSLAWQAYIAGDSKQIMYENRCYSIKFDSSKFLPSL